MRIIARFVVLSCLAAPAFATSASAPDANQSLSEQYKSCTQMAAIKPAETLVRAQKWFEESGQMAAKHCIALAQFEAKDYAAAAQTLDSILLGIKENQGNLWFSMKKQAAKANLYSGNGAGAERHLTDALRYANDHNMPNDMVPMLIDRAQIYAKRDEHLRAIQDMDNALALNNSSAVRLERAKIYLKMGDIKAAENDIRTVLKAEPLNEEASKMLGDLERRMNQLKSEEESKAQAMANSAAIAAAQVRGGGSSASASGGASTSAEPERKLSFDERVAKARAERAAKYGRSGGSIGARQ